MGFVLKMWPISAQLWPLWSLQIEIIYISVEFTYLTFYTTSKRGLLYREPMKYILPSLAYLLKHIATYLSKQGGMPTRHFRKPGWVDMLGSNVSPSPHVTPQSFNRPTLPHSMASFDNQGHFGLSHQSRAYTRYQVYGKSIYPLYFTN